MFKPRQNYIFGILCNQDLATTAKHIQREDGDMAKKNRPGQKRSEGGKPLSNYQKKLERQKAFSADDEVRILKGTQPEVSESTSEMGVSVPVLVTGKIGAIFFGGNNKHMFIDVPGGERVYVHVRTLKAFSRDIEVTTNMTVTCHAVTQQGYEGLRATEITAIDERVF